METVMHFVLSLMLIAAPVDVFNPEAGAFLEAVGDAEMFLAVADSLYRIADYEASAEYYLQGLHLQPQNSGAIYNLACCFGLMDRADLASVYLLRAWNAGFSDMEWVMGDPDFDQVRDDEVFASVADSLYNVAAAGDENLGEEVTFFATAPFSCRVRVPSDYDGSTPVPLLLGIHGYGGSPEGFIGLWEIVEDYGCIFAVPQGPTPFDIGGGIGYSWFTGITEEERYASSVASRDYVLSLLDELEKRYAFSEVYLFGYSQGGGMTYLVGLHAPERFTAIAPFSGWLDTSVLTAEELETAVNVPVRIVHGEQDRAVEYVAALQADSILSDMGYDVELFTFQGEHRFSRDGLALFLEEFISTP